MNKINNFFIFISVFILLSISSFAVQYSIDSHNYRDIYNITNVSVLKINSIYIGGTLFLPDDKLNTWDQRYNDTLMIEDVNSTIWAQLNNLTYNTSIILSDINSNITALWNNLTYYNNITNILILEINSSLWGNLTEINSVLTSQINNETQSRINNETIIYSLISNETQQRIDNDTLLQTNIDNLNTSMLNNISIINSNLSAIWGNLSNINYTFIFDNLTILYSAINNETQARIDNDTLLQININNLNTSMLNNISALNIAINSTFTVLNNTILDVNSTLWNEVNLKGNLNGNNLWIGNNSFLGNLIIWNATQTNYNSSIILKNGFGNVVFNVTTDGDVYATNYYGNINASYILNAPWLLATDQRYNDTLLIDGINQSVWNELNLKMYITDQRYNDTLLIDGINQSAWNELNLKMYITDQRYNDSLAINSVNNTFWQQDVLVREPTGMRDRTTSNLVFNDTTGNLTIVGTYDYYINGTKYTKTDDSIIIPNETQMNFIYYLGDTLQQSTTPWSFKSTAQIATIYYNKNMQSGIVGDERHGLTMDWQTHEYVHKTIGARYVSGFTGTFADTTFSLTSGEWYDDDLQFLTSPQNTCDVIYRIGSNTTWLYNQTQYYYKNATNMYYDNNGVLSPVTSNQYMAIWMFVGNDINTPIYCILGQRTDVTLANAIANNVPSSLSLGNLPIAELKSLYRLIIRNDGTPYEATGTLDYRTTSNLASGNYVATSHGTLTGLLADDHPQYILTDGTRIITGNLQFDTGFGIDANNVLNPYWLNETDQRYNDTQMILDLNNSLISIINNETQSRIDNETLLQNNINLINQSLIDNNTLIYSLIYNETQNRINNDTLLQTNIDNLNTSMLNNISIINSNLTALWNNISNINSNLSNEIQSRIGNDTLLQTNIDNLNTSMLNNISILNSNLGTAIDNNISAVNTAIDSNFTVLNNTILDVNSTLWNEVNLKGDLVGNNLWIGNNSFLGNLIIWNATQTNYNSSIILKDGLDNVVFNVTLTGDVYATNYYGNLNASYILNAPWLLATDQRYNDTLLIDDERQARIGNDTLINTNLTSVWGNMSTYLTNGSNARLNNVTINTLYINSTSSFMYFNSVTNNTIFKFIIGNLSFDDNSDSVMTLTQNDDVVMRNNLFVTNNITIGNSNSYLYRDTTGNTHLRFLQNNFTLWDGSHPVLIATQNDDVIIQNNLIVGNNITSQGTLFSREQDISTDGIFTTHSIYPNSPLTISGNVNSYLQVVLQNRNTSNLSSMDLVIGADLMTDTVNYIDLGYNGNNYSDSVYSGTDKNAGYLINTGTGNLSIISANSGIKFGTGNTTASNIRMTIDNTGNVTLTNQLNMQNNTKICMGDRCQVYIMYNSTGGFGEFG